MDQVLSVFRKEIKYIIPIAVANQIKDDMSKILMRDKHCPEHGYDIKSLYFDTIYDDDLYTKLAGTENRKKIRIRTYNNSSELCKLELKQKFGENQKKESLIISKDEVDELIKGNYQILCDRFDNNGVAVKIYSILQRECYRPKAIIEYNRVAFTYPFCDVRITVDSDVKSIEYYDNFFEENINYMPVLNDAVVLEVKFSGTLVGFIKEVLSKYNLEQVSYSKYSNGRYT